MSIAEDELSKLKVLSVQRHDRMRIDVVKTTATSGRDVLTGRSQPANEWVVRQRGAAGDLVSTCWASVFAVSGRFISCLESGKLTGWRTIPILIAGAARQTYHLFQVTGRAGPTVRGADLVPDGLGEYLDPIACDDSDFFVADNDSRILVRSVAAQIVEDARLVNVSLEPAYLFPLLTAK